MKRPDLERLAFAAVLLAGAALRCWQYFGRASLWLDEVAIAMNAIERPLASLLTKPLGFDQVAPAGFLAAVKLSLELFGDGELALRLFPFLTSLAALPVFAAVARRVLGARGSLFATALFSLGLPFFRYGSEVKQYSSDTLVALLLTLAVLELPIDDGPPTPYRRAALAGVLAACFSQSSVFVMTGLAAALVLDRGLQKNRPAIGPLSRMLVVWAAASGALMAWSLHQATPSTRAFLRHFWGSYFPIPTVTHRFGAPFALNRLLDFWGPPDMHFPLPGVYVALTLIGSAVLVRRNRRAALLLAGPIAVTFAASMARLYPFHGRLVLFLDPALILAAAAGASLVMELLSRIRVPRFVTAALLAFPAIAAVVGNPPVFSHEESRTLFEELARRRHPGDAVYVFYGAKPALRYYGPRTGLDPAGVTAGGCHRGDLAAYLREIDELRGRPRVWVMILQHQIPLREQQTIRAYCSTIGRRLESLSTPETGGESTLDLYDLSDPARLAAARADTFPLPEVNRTLALQLGCGTGPG